MSEADAQKKTILNLPATVEMRPQHLRDQIEWLVALKGRDRIVQRHPHNTAAPRWPPPIAVMAGADRSRHALRTATTAKCRFMTLAPTSSAKASIRAGEQGH